MPSTRHVRPRERAAQQAVERPASAQLEDHRDVALGGEGGALDDVRVAEREEERALARKRRTLALEVVRVQPLHRHRRVAQLAEPHRQTSPASTSSMSELVGHDEAAPLVVAQRRELRA